MILQRYNSIIIKNFNRSWINYLDYSTLTIGCTEEIIFIWSAFFLSLIFCNYSSVDDGKSLYSIPEIKLWTPQSIQTEFNQCTGIGLGQCGNFCSGIKSNKVAVVDCFNKNSKDISQCDDVYKALNDWIMKISWILSLNFLRAWVKVLGQALKSHPFQDQIHRIRWSPKLIQMMK